MQKSSIGYFYFPRGFNKDGLCIKNPQILFMIGELIRVKPIACCCHLSKLVYGGAMRRLVYYI